MTRPILILLTSVGLAAGLMPDATKQLQPFVRAGELLELADSSGTSAGPVDMYQRIGNVAFDASLFDRQDLVAFEENRLFVYAVGDASKLRDGPKGVRGADDKSRLIRRFIFLKPSTFVIDDEVQTLGSKRPACWSLYSHSKPEIAGPLTRFPEGEEELLCETLLPTNAAREGVRRPDRGWAEEHILNVTSQAGSGGARFLHVLHTRRSDEPSVARSELATQDGQLHLTITTGQQVFQLTLPPAQASPGDISISKIEGKTLVERRPLPSGILPHGVEGVRLLEQWDADYRRGRQPLWDAGMPSGELRRVVEDGTIRACRVVELGCGSGTDAVYLAGRGFDVTAIDIAPSALSQAGEKARKAGVQVRWLLADVLMPPKLDVFDFIYDRGCYHEVRGENLAAYRETVRRYSHPGTRFLLLAGSINETVLDYGPPRVAEEELRDDFSALFDFEWVRESRFEIAKPEAMGPLAWSVLMRRKAGAGPVK
jgi:methyl halide transferase